MCTLMTHDGEQVMYVAMPYFVLMQVMVACLIHIEDISHVWNPCFLLHFAVMRERVRMGRVTPSFMRDAMMALCCI